MKIEEKALRFCSALRDVYREEENRQLYAFEKLDLDLDTGDKESDLIDFTHALNKLAVQYIMDGRGEDATD